MTGNRLHVVADTPIVRVLKIKGATVCRLWFSCYSERRGVSKRKWMPAEPPVQKAKKLEMKALGNDNTEPLWSLWNAQHRM